MNAVANYRAAVFPGRIVLVRADTRDDWINVLDSVRDLGLELHW